MLISGTHLGIADQGQQNHNHRYPHEPERIFLRCMTEIHWLFFVTNLQNMDKND